MGFPSLLSVRRGVASTPPDAPSGLTATAKSDTRIDLAWTDNSDNEDEFVVYRDGVEIDRVGANVTSYVDTGLSASTQYCYEVSASNAVGESAKSNQACETTDAAAPDPPGTPSNNALSTVSSSRLDQSWGNVANEENYEVEIALDSGFTTGKQTATVSADVTSKSWTGLSEGTEYFARVRACNAGGCSAWSTTASAHTKHATPSLNGCCEGPDCGDPIGVNKTYKLQITDNAANNTSIKVYRNGSLYDTLPEGSQDYTPADQNDGVDWHVTAAGGSVPESAASATVTTPFSTQCLS